MNAKPPLIEAIWSKKLTFLFVYFLVFLFSYIFLVAIDFLPEPVTNEAEVETEEVIESTTVAEVATEEVEESEISVVNQVVLPTEIYIERLDKTIDVLNPASRTIADLE